MKFLTKIAILTLAISSTLATAATARHQACADVEGGKSCLSFQVVIPDYPYPWLTNFVLPETFDDEESKLTDLQKLSVHYVNEVLAESEIGNDQEKVTWSPIEEAGDYLQVSKNEYIKSESEEEPTESVSYYVFNKKNPAQALSLEDLVLSPEAEKSLGEALKSRYLTWQKNHNTSEEEAKTIVDNFLENGEMIVSDNWFLAKDMIVFNYGSSEIGPPSYGSVNLAMPIAGLEGIIKPEILQAAQQWTTSFNAK